MLGRRRRRGARPVAPPVELSPGTLRDALPLPLLDVAAPNEAVVLNTYRACDIRCAYCITRAQGRSTPRVAPSEVRARLTDELAATLPISRLGVGGFVDVYPGAEADLGVTRTALEVLADHGLGFRLITKGTTVWRDRDLLARGDVEVQVSLNTLSSAAVARVEPGAAPPEARLATLHRLRDHGVHVRLQLSPWIPGTSDVGALLDRVEGIPVTITPLRIPDYLTRARHVTDLDQAGINEAYRREYEAVGPRPLVLWSRPPPLDGAPPHISDNVGRSELVDTSPAEVAPHRGDPVWLDPPRRARPTDPGATGRDG